MTNGHCGKNWQKNPLLVHDNREEEGAPMAGTDEFLQLTGLSAERFHDIVALGWLEVTKDYSFSDADIYRVRKLVRICTDFDLPVIGGTIIVDLLERIAALEETVRRLKHNADIS